MILIFGIDRYKVKLHEKRMKLEQMSSIIHSGSKVPFWYVKDRDKLAAQVARLEKIIELKEKSE